MTVTKICDFPTNPSGLSSNIGDFARNPQDGLYYGVRDFDNAMTVFDLNTCTESRIPLSQNMNGSVGAFWVSADGIGYGYTNQSGQLFEFDLSTGDVNLIGTGPGTAQTDGCACEGLRLHKEVNVDTTQAGSTISYTFTFFNVWNSDLNNITFQDTLRDGLTWASEPYNITGGITLESNTNISGLAIAEFEIESLLTETVSFTIDVDIPSNYSGPEVYLNQAHLSDLPELLGFTDISDWPVSSEFDDPTPVVILPSCCQKIYVNGFARYRIKGDCVDK